MFSAVTEETIGSSFCRAEQFGNPTRMTPTYKKMKRYHHSVNSTAKSLIELLLMLLQSTEILQCN
jgi:hypothetical protein